MSVGAAALLLANPIIGAAVYAGSLLAQKAMQDPIEQMFSYRLCGDRQLVGSGGRARRSIPRAGGSLGKQAGYAAAMSAAGSADSIRVAAVQTVSGGDVAANLAAIEPLVVAATEQGAALVLLPEYFGIFGARATDKVDAREADGHGPQQDFLSRVAREQRLWLIGGTVPIATADPARVRSASLVFDPHGQRVARYDKIHLFAFSQGDERYDEATHDRARRAPASPSIRRAAASACRSATTCAFPSSTAAIATSR